MYMISTNLKRILLLNVGDEVDIIQFDHFFFSNKIHLVHAFNIQTVFIVAYKNKVIILDSQWMKCVAFINVN